MKKIIQTVVAVVFIASMAGCATPYMVDRRRDAADIFTCTVGKGIGAGVSAGPLHAGLLANRDCIGLRGGDFFSDCGPIESYWGSSFTHMLQLDVTLITLETSGSGGRSTAPERGKTYEGGGIIPFICQADSHGYTPYYYYTRIEALVGLGLSLRIGLNPGEFIDFVLGWTTIDIFKDDLEAKKQKEESNQSSATPKPGAPQ